MIYVHMQIHMHAFERSHTHTYTQGRPVRVMQVSQTVVRGSLGAREGSAGDYCFLVKFREKKRVNICLQSLLKIFS